MRCTRGRDRWAAGIVAAMLAMPSLGCPKRTPAEALATTPDYAKVSGQAKCGVTASAAKPLIVEWPSADRAALEARANRSLVVVRYEGCEMEVLTNCSAMGTYGYHGLNQKRESVRIHDADELYAQLPVGAAGLEAKLERAGQLNVDMVIIGRKESAESKFTERDLEGRCDDATHVITGLTIGAFSFYAGASAAVGAGVKVGNIGVGAQNSHGREVLKQDGDEDACTEADQDAEEPPEGCGALLRVEVVPIDRIFGVSRPATVAGTSPSSTPTSTATDTSSPTPSDPRLDQKIRNSVFLTYGGGYLGIIGGITLLGAGYGVYSSAKKALEGERGNEAVSSERSDNIKKARTGIGLAWGGVGLAALGISLAVIGSVRTRRLKARRGYGNVQPLLGPGFAGVGVGGHF